MLEGVFLTHSADLSAFLGDDPVSLSYIFVAEAEQVAEIMRKAGLPAGQSDPVGIIDSGANPSHPQLAGRIIEMVSFTDAYPQDTLGHGTAVAITAAQFGPLLYIAKVSDARHRIEMDAVLGALEWMEAKGVNIINMSVGFEVQHPEAGRLCARIAEMAARNDQLMIFAAAGNRGADVAYVPATCGMPVMAVASPEETSGRGNIRASLPGVGTRADYLRAEINRMIAAAEPGPAVPLIAELLRIAPPDLATLQVAAELHYHTGDLPGARAAADAALNLAPRSDKARWISALIHARLGLREAALHDLDQLDPAHDEPLAEPLRRFLQDTANPLPDGLAHFFRSQPR